MTDSSQPRLLQLTAASLYRDIGKLAWPVMLGTGLHMVFNLADTFWVSQLGSVLVAIPGLAGSLIWIFMSLAEAISVGTVAMISRYEGARRRNLMAQVITNSFWLSLVLAMLIGVLVAAFAKPLLMLFTNDVNLLPLAEQYLYITIVGVIFTFGTMSISATLNGIGDTRTPMLVMLVANAFNIVLDPLLIFGWLGFPALGVLGAAWATLAANAIALVVLVVILVRHKALDVPTLWARLSLPVVTSILKIGLPASLQSASRSSTGTVMFWLVMRGHGEEAAAAFSAGQRILGLIFVVLSGLSVAATTITGQILGAGKRALARLAARRLIVMGIIVQVVIGLGYFALARPLNVVFFSDNAQALAAGISYVRICGLGLALGASSSVIGGIFKGAGYTMPTFWAGFIANWLIKLPLAALSTLVFDGPVEGVWLAISVSIVVEWLLLAVWQRRGTWLDKEIPQVSA